MESVRCYLCDHEFVEGEEPWLMFEQRLREDGEIECSLANLLGTILDMEINESVAHSTLLCDSCNADVLEYESLEKRFQHIKERIVISFRENFTVQNLENINIINDHNEQEKLNVKSQQDKAEGEANEEEEEAAEEEANEEEEEAAEEEEEAAAVVDQLINPVDFNNITDIDLVEEIGDDEEEISKDIYSSTNNLNDTLNVSQGPPDEEDTSQTISNIPYNFDFSAFNEHVAQNSLPSSVLNLSDSLISLSIPEPGIHVENGDDIIIYDVSTNKIIDNQESSQDVPDFSQTSATVDDNYNNTSPPSPVNIMNTKEIFKLSKSKSDTNCSNNSLIDSTNNMLLVDDDELIPPKVVCKKQGIVFICHLCKISPQFEKQTLIKHFEIFHNSKFFMCEQCNDGFGSKRLMEIHEIITHRVRCNLCRETFSNNHQQRVHKKYVHKNTKSHECQVCGKKYAAKGILDEHMNTHTGLRPYKCTECSKDFGSKYTLLTHMKIHKERPRPFECDQCQKQFLNLQNLNQHKKLHVAVKAFKCDICEKNFATQHSLQVHTTIHTGQRPFICRICSKSFARRQEIKDHERIHTGEKPFKCDLCPQMFTQRSNLISHRKSTHLNEKLHKCDQCLRSFKRKRLLEYHIQSIHTGERPHKCGVCGAGFVYPEHYKKHMLIHSGKKPFACEVCGKQFNSRDNRNAHRFVHSDKKPYECMECGAGFMRKPLLISHMKQTKHVNDTIIVNQPHFTQQHDLDNDSQSSESNMQIKSEILEDDLDLQYMAGNIEEMLADDPSSEHLDVENDDDDDNDDTASCADVDDVIRAVNGQLIKDDLGDVKYLQFENLDRDGQETLTWVTMAENDDNDDG